jgi:hypothetical protein
MSDVPETNIVLTMETVSTSETNINLYETIGRNIPEDTHLVYFCIYFLHAQSLKIQIRKLHQNPEAQIALRINSLPRLN